MRDARYDQLVEQGFLRPICLCEKIARDSKEIHHHQKSLVLKETQDICLVSMAKLKKLLVYILVVFVYYLCD